MQPSHTSSKSSDASLYIPSPSNPRRLERIVFDEGREIEIRTELKSDTAATLYTIVVRVQRLLVLAATDVVHKAKITSYISQFLLTTFWLLHLSGLREAAVM